MARPPTMIVNEAALPLGIVMDRTAVLLNRSPTILVKSGPKAPQMPTADDLWRMSRRQHVASPLTKDNDNDHQFDRSVSDHQLVQILGRPSA